MLSKIKNYIKKNTGILIRLDDIAENMNWDLMSKSEFPSIFPLIDLAIFEIEIKLLLSSS